MAIIYSDTKKDLPCDQLYALFLAVGWSDGPITPAMLEKFNVPFLNSALVVSAWDHEQLVGAVRVISDRMFRSIIYDLAVLPPYQNQGVGKTLLKRCISHFPDSEWLVQTKRETAGYYEKNGFQVNHDTFLSIPCKWFSKEK